MRASCMILKILTVFFGLSVGGWMLADGIYVLMRGKYMGPQKPGPWSLLFLKLGINPFGLGPLFIAFGVLWLIFLIGLLAGQTWGWYGTLVMAIASLWYLPVGTSMSVICL